MTFPSHRLGALLCCALATLTGCGIARPPAQVAAPTPPQWNAPLPHGGSLASLADWWRAQGDPLLVELIESAQAVSPSIASAATRIAEARATRVSAGAALLPSLDGTLSATRGNNTFTSGGFGTSSSTGTGSTSTTTSTTSTTSSPISTAPLTTLQAGLQSRWEIDLSARLRADRDAAQARLSGADARWHDARVSVAAETANAYYAERACQAQLAVAERDTGSRAETARLTDLSARAGFTAPADAALARASASDASARLLQQRAQCVVQRKALVALTGLDAPILEQKLAAAPASPSLPAIESIASVPAEALAQRPDVYAAELAVAAASADVGSADAQRYPKLTLSGSIGRLQIRTGAGNQAFDTWSIGPLSLSLPILDGGVRAANSELARARYAEAVSTYQGNVRQAVREVEEALVNLQSTDARSGDADDAVRNYQASFDATQARYQSGLASLFQLEDARRTLFAAQTARVALQRERTQAWVSLYRSMGGGWSRPADAYTPSASMTPSNASATP